MYKIIRKIIAAAGVIILGGLYIAAFVSAFSSQGSSGDLFKACIFCTVLFPILLYGMGLVHRAVTGRKDPSDRTDPSGSGGDEKKSSH